MADSIIDPNVIESGAAVKEKRFLSNFAPIITGIAGAALLGPAAGVGLAALQRKSTLLDLERAEDRESIAVAEYQQRMRAAGSYFDSALDFIDNTYAEIPGVDQSVIEGYRKKAANLRTQAMSFNPEEAQQARLQLRAIPAEITSRLEGLDTEAITQQRDLYRSELQELQDSFFTSTQDANRAIGNIDEALGRLSDPDFDVTKPINRARLLQQLGSGVDTTGLIGSALSTIPLIGPALGGFIDAGDVNLSPEEWRDALLAARNNITGTLKQQQTGIAEYTQRLEPVLQQYKIVAPGTTGVDYVTGAVPELNKAPDVDLSRRKAAADPRTGGPPATRVERESRTSGGATTSVSAGFGALMDFLTGDYARQEAEAMENIRRGLEPGFDVGITDSGMIVQENTATGEIRALRLTKEQEQAVRRRLERQREAQQ